MTDSIPDLPIPAPVAAVAQVQRLTDVVSRAAAQSAIVGSNIPISPKESPKAANPVPTTLGYDKRGEMETEEEEVGRRLNLIA